MWYSITIDYYWFLIVLNCFLWKNMNFSGSFDEVLNNYKHLYSPFCTVTGRGHLRFTQFCCGHEILTRRNVILCGGHEILTRGNVILCRGHEIVLSYFCHGHELNVQTNLRDHSNPGLPEMDSFIFYFDLRNYYINYHINYYIIQLLYWP